MKINGAIAFMLAVGTALTLSADEVFFKSGDKLTGTVKSVSGGKMVFDSKVAGKITLNLDDIRTFTTTESNKFVSKDGSVIVSAVAPSSQDGNVIVANRQLAMSQIDKVNPEPIKWTGKVGASATLIRGNTDSTSVSLGFDAARRSEIFRLSVAGSYFTEEQKNLSTKESHMTADNWYLKGQADWFFTAKNFFYLNAKYERDRIALLDYRFMPGVGYGYQWIERDNFNFSTEAGLTYTKEEYMDEDGEKNDFMTARFAYHLDYTVLSKVKLYHNLEYIPNLEDSGVFLVNADAGVQAPLTARLSLDSKIVYAYNSSPADDRYRTDTRYLVGLSWLF